MTSIPDRILLHLGPGLRRPIDPAEIYYLEADADDTLIRTRSSQRLRDVRPLGELEELFAPHGFSRVHRNHMVNLRRVVEIRKRVTGEDWELKLMSPVNRVLPISRAALAGLWVAMGE